VPHQEDRIPTACNHILRLENPVQYYAWGSKNAIADLTGRDLPSPKPEAELWMGAHPKAPSMVMSGEGTVALNELIARHPREILGEGVAREFAGQLPFLFKVLAADQPLSIQAHPDHDQARMGFDRENQAGIPLDAPHRNYRDNNHKPEIICALTDFWGLSGFRPLEDLLRRLRRYCRRSLQSFIVTLHNAPPEHGLRQMFQHLLSLQGRERDRTIAEAVGQAAHDDALEPVSQWILKLEKAYPGDIGVLAPVLLNLIHLRPEQALYLPAGHLHAYLEGVGIELMANSDNVLRGGLTPKHIDRAELMRVLQFEPRNPAVMKAERLSRTVARFSTPTHEFALEIVAIAPDAPHEAPRHHNVEILLVTDGEATLQNDPADKPMHLARGDSVLIPAAAGAYGLTGHATIYRATVP
jgi:mannose-6-phosphate isomerase